MEIIDEGFRIRTSAGGWLTQEQLESMNRQKQERRENPLPAPETPARSCPFRDGASMDCKKSGCAWYSGGGCSMRCPHPGADRWCPIRHNVCRIDCALRNT